MIEDRMKSLGIKLPSPPVRGGVYTMVKQCGDLLYISGQGPVINGIITWKGKVGSERSVEEGQKAARDCMLNYLAALNQYLGSLDRITDFIKILGLVQSAEGFGDQPLVMNAATQMIKDIFGEDKLPSRSAIGVNELPGNITVEIEGIVKFS